MNISAPPGWDASPSQGYSELNWQYPLIHLGGERLCGSQVSCPRTQLSVPGQGSNPDCLIWSWVHQPRGHCTSHYFFFDLIWYMQFKGGGMGWLKLSHAPLTWMQTGHTWMHTLCIHGAYIFLTTLLYHKPPVYVSRQRNFDMNVML